MTAATEPVGGQPQIRLERVSREFADGTGLHQTSLTIGRGEFVSILGPSGCGKSTMLRCIAGLETPNTGVIEFAGREVFSGKINVPANKRGLSMVFQDLALWPHMSVAKNVEFPLTTGGHKMPSDKRAKAVFHAMEMVGIANKADAKPAELSGGQQQRVAIARALVSSPQVILMDEPLSALDAALRVQIRAELTALAADLGLTVVYVTHDQAEALAMSDRIVVMNAGHVEQFADPVTLYGQPATDFVAGFVGVMNEHPRFPHVRPENVEVYSGNESRPGGAYLSGIVASAQYVGGRYELHVDVDGAEHQWVAYTRSRFGRGDVVDLLVRPVSINM